VSDIKAILEYNLALELEGKGPIEELDELETREAAEKRLASSICLKKDPSAKVLKYNSIKW
jgi:hypothetical protein